MLILRLKILYNFFVEANLLNIKIEGFWSSLYRLDNLIIKLWDKE